MGSRRICAVFRGISFAAQSCARAACTRALSGLVAFATFASACEPSRQLSEAIGTSAVALSTPCANEPILGFESAAEWKVSSGAVSLSSSHTEGASSLAVASPVNYTTLVSASLSSSDTELSGIAVGTSLELDVELPTRQPNAFWFGTLQMFVSAPSRGVFNQYLGLVELTGLPLGMFQTVSFSIPNNVAQALAGQTYADLTFTIALNVPSSGTGVYLFDNLRVLGAPGSGTNVRPTVLCVNQKGPHQFEALFGYTSANLQPIEIPVGPSNTFAPGPPGQGQPVRFMPRMVNPFAVVFDGTPLTWSLAGGCAVASSASPACPATACSPSCLRGHACVGAQCGTECGDGLCAGNENCTSCPADCACAAGQVCAGDVCATPAVCGVDWQCGSGTSFGVPVDCGPCPGVGTCNNHVCQ